MSTAKKSLALTFCCVSMSFCGKFGRPKDVENAARACDRSHARSARARTVIYGRALRLPSRPVSRRAALERPRRAHVCFAWSCGISRARNLVRPPWIYVPTHSQPARRTAAERAATSPARGTCTDAGELYPPRRKARGERPRAAAASVRPSVRPSRGRRRRRSAAATAAPPRPWARAYLCKCS